MLSMADIDAVIGSALACAEPFKQITDSKAISTVVVSWISLVLLSALLAYGVFVVVLLRPLLETVAPHTRPFSHILVNVTASQFVLLSSALTHAAAIVCYTSSGQQHSIYASHRSYCIQKYFTVHLKLSSQYAAVKMLCQSAYSILGRSEMFTISCRPFWSSCSVFSLVFLQSYQLPHSTSNLHQ